MQNSIIKIEVQLQGIDSVNSDRQQVQDAVYNKYGAHFLCSFTESRTAAVIPQEKRRDLDNTINPRTAVKMWAAEKFEEVEDQNVFIQMAFDTMTDSSEA